MAMIFGPFCLAVALAGSTSTPWWHTVLQSLSGLVVSLGWLIGPLVFWNWKMFRFSEPARRATFPWLSTRGSGSNVSLSADARSPRP